MSALPVHPGWRKPTLMLRRPPRKLSWAEVTELRAAYARRTQTQAALAAAYGISQPLVSQIVRGLQYAVPEPIRAARPPAPVLTPAERIARWTAAVNAAPSPLMDAKQAAIDARNADEAPWGYRAFRDGR